MDTLAPDVSGKANYLNDQLYSDMVAETDYENILKRQKGFFDEIFSRSGQSPKGLEGTASSGATSSGSYGSSYAGSDFKPTDNIARDGVIKRNHTGKFSVDWTTDEFRPVVINIIPKTQKTHERNMRVC